MWVCRNGEKTLQQIVPMSLFIWKSSLEFEPPFAVTSNPLDFLADFTFLHKKKFKF
jgi:hypothetical protein